MKNKVLLGLQIVLFILWAIASHSFSGDFNLFVFNILPIPNFGLVIFTFVLVMIGYWLQSLKDEGKE
jgi:hypothetical protein